MTKFETLLKLSEIKGALVVADNIGQIVSVLEDVCELIDELQDDDGKCHGCGCPSHDRCHGCGQFHE